MERFLSVKQCMEEKNCKLLGDENNYIIQKIKKKIKVKYIAACGHENIVQFDNFKYKNSGIKCPKCITTENSISKRKCQNITNDGQSIWHNIEDISIEYLREIFKNNYELKRTEEGCLADFAIRNNNSMEDKWLPIQLKVTNYESKFGYSFNCSKKYKDCVILLLCWFNKKIWILNGNEITINKRITIGIKKSKYDIFECKDKNDVIIRLNQYLNSYFLNNINNINKPISIFCQKEQKFKKIREQITFLHFIYPERTYLPYDFMINNYKIQEKVSTKCKKVKCACQTIISRSKDRSTMKKRYYKEEDNDYYWINHYNENDFYIIPVQVLIDRDYITTDKKQATKTSLYISNTDLLDYKFQYNNIENNKERILKLFNN